MPAQHLVEVAQAAAAKAAESQLQVSAASVQTPRIGKLSPVTAAATAAVQLQQQ
jgi:hypothetical protein